MFLLQYTVHIRLRILIIFVFGTKLKNCIIRNSSPNEVHLIHIYHEQINLTTDVKCLQNVH